MRQFVTATFLLLICLASVAANETEVLVGDIDFPQRVWGEQHVSFDVTNLTDYVKYISVGTDVSFEDSFIPAQRSHTSNFLLPPQSTVTIDPVIEIASNYGKATINFKVWDVVDTLDDPGLGTLVLEQPFKLMFHRPDGVYKYLQEKITTPPLMENVIILNSEFSRVLLLMLAEGKSIEQIAETAQTDPEYVTAELVKLQKYNIVSLVRGETKLLIPVLNIEQAETGRTMADKLAPKLVAAIEKNIPAIVTMRDSLIAAGELNGDPDDFLGGSQLAFSPYPLVMAISLWHVLGTEFITDGKYLTPFDNSSPCRPNPGLYMYLIQGGDVFNGHHFYLEHHNRTVFDIRFGDSIPTYQCFEGWEEKSYLQELKDWQFDERFQHEPYMVDTGSVWPIARHVASGAAQVLDEARANLHELYKLSASDPLPAGLKYWFWNLVCSKAGELMLTDGTLERQGNGQFMLKALPKGRP